MDSKQLIMIIDLRSDTVTQPTPAMKAAMLDAPLGDDVLGDDPSVQELETYGAALFGKEAALFCPSGTMTNQIALKINTHAPGEVMCDGLSHIYQYEGGGAGFISGLATHLLQGTGGRLTAEQIEAAIRPDDVHFPTTQLVSLENTCNKAGGTVYELSEIKKIRRLCEQKGIKLHLDGARVFNAVAASDYTEQDLGAQFDTLSVCLSKGLGAPVGSLLLGDAQAIRQARRIRKVLGGGMRQSGLLAAAGTYALRHHRQRLQEDHAHAQQAAAWLQQHPKIETVLPVPTNIVIANTKSGVSAAALVAAWEAQGIRALAIGPQQIRLVLHLDVTPAHMQQLEQRLAVPLLN